MSFFGGLKRALGWSGDDEENEDYISYESSSDKQVALQGMKEETEANESVVLDFSDEIPEGVFDGLIEIVNANLSPMVLKCLDVEAEKKVVLSNDNFTQVASIILEGVGGKENVKSIDNCVTRLRLEIKDYTKVDEKKIKSAGVAGVIRPGKTSVQVVVGTKVQFVADEFKKLCK